MKREVYFIFILSALYILIFSFSNVHAMSGISPPSYEIDFKPNYQGDFRFNFFFDEGTKQKVEVQGDLAEYVKLDKTLLEAGGVVIASLKFPSEIEIPGSHIIGISAKSFSEEGEGFGISGNPVGMIEVKVPYPGKYVEMSLSISNVNAGDNVTANLSVVSKGKEEVMLEPSLFISGSEGEEEVKLEQRALLPTQSTQYVYVFDTLNYKPGDYNLSASIYYGGEKPTSLTETFRLGELRVGVSNYTKELQRGMINRIEIETESFWNDKIDGVYAEANVIGLANSNFLTPSISIDPWGKAILTGFLDTSRIKRDDFKLNTTIHYSGKTTNEILDIKVKNKNFEINYTVVILILAIIVLLTIIIIMWCRTRKYGKKKK